MYPGLIDEPNKEDKSNVPEDAFYHLYEMNLDGSGARRLTQGKYDNFDGRYLPDQRIVFCSTRRGQAVQAGRQRCTKCRPPGSSRHVRPLRRRPSTPRGRVHPPYHQPGGP
jgi:hypothetical protein